MRNNSDPEYFRHKKLYKSLLQSTRRKYYSNQELRIIEEAETDRSNFWKIIRSRPQTINQCEVPISVWYEHFSHLLGTSACDEFIHPVTSIDDYNRDYFDSLFTEFEVCYMINAQPSGKATGPDGISYEIMKN